MWVTGLIFSILAIQNQQAETIWDLPKLSEEELNIGKWALIIAREYDPSVDVSAHLASLDAIAQKVIAGLPNSHEDMAKVMISQIVLYEPGEWNNDKPFAYNLKDPLGEELQTKLLSNILATRKGNCVSMPTLYLAVMERVAPDVPFAGVRAPFHLYCRFRDRQTGLVLNFEATTGQATKDLIDTGIPVSEQARASGLYHRELSKRKYLAELIEVLVARERRNGRLEKALSYADLMLKSDPDSAHGLVHKAGILHEQGYQLTQKAKRENRKLSTGEHQRARELEKQGNDLLRKAENLGWKPLSAQFKQRYLKEMSGYDRR